MHRYPNCRKNMVLPTPKDWWSIFPLANVNLNLRRNFSIVALITSLCNISSKPLPGKACETLQKKISSIYWECNTRIICLPYNSRTESGSIRWPVPGWTGLHLPKNKKTEAYSAGKYTIHWHVSWTEGSPAMQVSSLMQMTLASSQPLFSTEANTMVTASSARWE